MWEYDYFDQDKMKAWEKEYDDDKYWYNMVDYFGALWQNQKQYSRATSKRERFAERVKKYPRSPT